MSDLTAAAKANRSPSPVASRVSYLQVTTSRPSKPSPRIPLEAHLSIVFAAMAVSHYIEHRTGWSIKKFVRTTRRYRTVKIKAGRQTLTAADPLTDDLRDALAKIGCAGVH